MAGTRSSVKRKSICSSPAAPSSPPEPPSSSAPKRQKLPLRKKASRTLSGAAGEDVQDRLDLDAALQAEVAAGTPDTPLPTRVVSAAPAAAAAVQDDEGEDSDSDEAPEEVSNVQAGTRAKAAVEAMKKAAKEETERIRQKRKERDARLKDQARARKPKPEAAPEAEAKAESDADADAGAEEKVDETAVTSTATAVDVRKPSRGKIEIPTFLPEEFLSSDSEDDGDDDAGPPSKRRKAGVGARKRAEPRDKRVGGTVFRVVKQVDARMAPKGEGRTKSVRTALLKRGREEGARRAGFLVGGKKKADWGTSRR
ncbi:uncharacterized protein DNG_07257 [Cephalotrichum gorgonifer]|uniref:Uncharacterized protein n=1 Tax=Cephalotrichum gorgonifer TaxID=2041049 RepID=A0AAE8N483_9PEZI|nr:uncharacterized protein DNG_07257 [Cephalotrichum gorgonifer]